MGIFDNLRQYGGQWKEKSRRVFTEEEKNEITEAVVVESQYGLSGRFTRSNHAVVYIPMANDATLGIGEPIDMSKAQIVTLTKAGENDIFRVSI